MNATYKILNTEFIISFEQLDISNYIDSFLGVYQDNNTLDNVNQIHIICKKSCIPETIDGKEIKVHTSKHLYWNFCGEMINDGISRTVLWQSRKILIEITDNTIIFSYSDDLDDFLIGESLFHIMRGFALYLRVITNTVLLHASCVETNGIGILFAGDVSAGKTTLLLNALEHLNANPISNDRTLVCFNNGKAVAHSWPSFVSLCEGTILNNPSLLNMYNNESLFYERFNIDKNIQLSNKYDKLSKRIYPMSWLCEAFQKEYVSSVPIKLIINSELNTDFTSVRIENIQNYNEIIDSLIDSQRLDIQETSFEPWHGLKYVPNKLNSSFIADRLKNNQVCFYSLKANPTLTEEIANEIRKILECEMKS